jgi:ATP-dependent RNA helicase HelY
MAPGTSSTEDNRSPAERYAAAKNLKKLEALDEFQAIIKFPLDKFQYESCRFLATDKSVLVAAPTGAGKTIVGEFAIHLAISKGLKVIYTTPIKALSNQKFSELQKRYGAERVGLLTGDTNNNGDAQIVVMTTEVLRNMIYANSDSLRNLGYVVMDEVHYLADRFRGAVGRGHPSPATRCEDR